MRQPVVHENTARQREHLRLVLQPAERSREDETVIVPLEFRTVLLALCVQGLQTETFVGDELFPVHIIKFGAKIDLKIDKDADSSDEMSYFRG